VLDYALLAALAAVIRTGSFEQAAQQLHVTPSAVSQRVKLLEERLGTILVVRGTPCVGTPRGGNVYVSMSNRWRCWKASCAMSFQAPSTPGRR
jgi:DNA-binding transcriptional LysR family regulator